MAVRANAKRNLRAFHFNFASDFRARHHPRRRAISPSIRPDHLWRILSTSLRICFASRLFARKIFLPRVRVRSGLCKLRAHQSLRSAFETSQRKAVRVGSYCAFNSSPSVVFRSSKTFLRWIVILIPECDLESSWLAATANLCLFMYLCFWIAPGL